MPRLAEDDRVVGTSGYVTYEDPDADQAKTLRIPITYWKANVKKSFQDATNSRNYDPKTELICPTRVQVSVEVVGEIAGRFRLAVIPPTFVKAAFSGKISPIINLYVTTDYKFGEGHFHLSEFSIGVPYDGTVDFQSQILSQGPFEFNDDPVLTTPHPSP